MYGRFGVLSIIHAPNSGCHVQPSYRSLCSDSCQMQTGYQTQRVTESSTSSPSRPDPDNTRSVNPNPTLRFRMLMSSAPRKETLTVLFWWST